MFVGQTAHQAIRRQRRLPTGRRDLTAVRCAPTETSPTCPGDSPPSPRCRRLHKGRGDCFASYRGPAPSAVDYGRRHGGRVPSVQHLLLSPEQAAVTCNPLVASPRLGQVPGGTGTGGDGPEVAMQIVGRRAAPVPVGRCRTSGSQAPVPARLRHEHVRDGRVVMRANVFRDVQLGRHHAPLIGEERPMRARRCLPFQISGSIPTIQRC